MNTENKDMDEMKLYDILVTFNDATYVSGKVMAKNDSSVYKTFIQLPEMEEAMKAPNRKILQYTICEREIVEQCN